MWMKRQSAVQGDLIVAWSEIPRLPGHVFYDRLQTLLAEARQWLSALAGRHGGPTGSLRQSCPAEGLASDATPCAGAAK
jgi:hypothetical protein